MTDIVLITFRRDLEYCRWCLKSMQAFCSGFNALRIVVPHEDVAMFRDLSLEFLEDFPMRITVRGFDEWPNHGHMCHEWQVMQGDLWSGSNIISRIDTDSVATIICHMDSDSVFTGPVTPETYAPGGKPILRWESYESIMARRPDHGQWCDVTRKCLPFKNIVDAMKCHPNCYHRSTYGLARIMIEQKTGKKAEDYIRAGKNDFPYEFCEYVTLGNVALHGPPHLYIPVQQDGRTLNPDNHVAQCWSHSPPEIPQDIYVKGGMRRCAPIEIFREIGIA